MRTIGTIALVLCFHLGCVGEYELQQVGPDAGAQQEEEDPDAAPPPPETAQQLLAEWSGCMTLDNWQASNMSAWSLKVSEGGTVCSSCHADGLARFNANEVETDMFTSNRYEVFITGFFTVATVDGVLDVVPAYDKLNLVGGGQSDHPTFAAGPSDPYFEILDNFYQRTVTARSAGACASTGFPTPP